MHGWSILFSIITILSNIMKTFLRLLLLDQTHCNVDLECVTLMNVLETEYN